MKLGHIAALALTGWYLMMPPAPETKPVPPLSGWVHLHDFNTKAQCEQQREEDKHPSMIWSGRWGSSTGEDVTPTEQELSVSVEERCIASDDPRLKEK